jgi:hypothetical protein
MPPHGWGFRCSPVSSEPDCTPIRRCHGFVLALGQGALYCNKIQGNLSCLPENMLCTSFRARLFNPGEMFSSLGFDWALESRYHNNNKVRFLLDVMLPEDRSIQFFAGKGLLSGSTKDGASCRSSFDTMLIHRTVSCYSIRGWFPIVHTALKEDSDHNHCVEVSISLADGTHPFATEVQDWVASEVQVTGNTLCLLSSRFYPNLRHHRYQEVGLRSSGEKRSYIDGSLEVSIQAWEKVPHQPSDTIEPSSAVLQKSLPQLTVHLWCHALYRCLPCPHFECFCEWSCSTPEGRPLGNL